MTGPAPQRIAILHFTAPPSVGGVEALLAAQARCLRESGFSVTVIAGDGEMSADYDLTIIPEMHPNLPTVRSMASESQPVADHHPMAAKLLARLRPILEGHDQVWVHNAFTVNLNPFLTAALIKVMAMLSRPRWVAFCHDLSVTSRYVGGIPETWFQPPDVRGKEVRYVVISEARRRELSAVWNLPEEEICVIPPPLDVMDWLDVGSAARLLANKTTLIERDLAFVVPAKLLPHKRIEIAIHVLAELEREGIDAAGIATGAPSPHEPDSSAAVAAQLGALAKQRGVENRFYLAADVLGCVPDRRTVRDLMSLCDLVFLPSAEEGYGTPISEAITMRTPVLCSDIPAFREAAGDFAPYAPPDMNPTSVARRMVDIACAPASVRRREVMRSMDRFQEALVQLART